ncbi:lysoplasmalogenase [Aurantiacibacter sp. MUD11]|uniref:lysoplasmalogenase n=1 Tax=Aurantiacibacter sp. MUD11 TaxID=3003265 RepID=UPI0022AAAA37|nr:lysoplasmalogenase [Aurantiacibacter sp. MUD11]WAT18412.1 lysoplasmalogenase [Aurantiacibacter sp. MUD11]
MPRRALVQKRPYLLLSLLAAIAYFYLQASELPELYLWPIKGSACAFLAIYCWLRHQSDDARLMAGAMAMASIADMAIEFSLEVGAGIFILFHILAIRVFTRNNQGPLSKRDNWVFLLILIGTPIAAYLLPYDRSTAWLVALYAAVLAIMAASAWASNFPRAKVAAGAILFVISDLLIFSGMGPLSGSPIPQYLVWPIYYLGQFLITVGVITTLRKRDPELRVVQGGGH